MDNSGISSYNFIFILGGTFHFFNKNMLKTYNIYLYILLLTKLWINFRKKQKEKLLSFKVKVVQNLYSYQVL